VRGFGETDFDNRIVDISGARRRERRKRPELLGRESDDLHILAEQHHGVHRDGYSPGTETQEATEVYYDQSLTICVAHQAAESAEHVLAFNRTENWRTDC
jgi:hypothetical protein